MKKSGSGPGCGTIALLVLAAVLVAGFVDSIVPADPNTHFHHYGAIFITCLLIAFGIFLLLRMRYYKSKKKDVIDQLNWTSINHTMSEIGINLMALSSIQIESIDGASAQARVIDGARFFKSRQCWYIERTFTVSDRTFINNCSNRSCRFHYSQPFHGRETAALSRHNYTLAMKSNGFGTITVDTTIPDYVDKNSALNHLTLTDRGILNILSYWN